MKNIASKSLGQYLWPITISNSPTRPPFCCRLRQVLHNAFVMASSTVCYGWGCESVCQTPKTCSVKQFLRMSSTYLDLFAVLLHGDLFRSFMKIESDAMKPRWPGLPKWDRVVAGLASQKWRFPEVLVHPVLWWEWHHGQTDFRRHHVCLCSNFAIWKNPTLLFVFWTVFLVPWSCNHDAFGLGSTTAPARRDRCVGSPAFPCQPLRPRQMPRASLDANCLPTFAPCFHLFTAIGPTPICCDHRLLQAWAMFIVGIALFPRPQVMGQRHAWNIHRKWVQLLLEIEPTLDRQTGQILWRSVTWSFCWSVGTTKEDYNWEGWILRFPSTCSIGIPWGDQQNFGPPELGTYYLGMFFWCPPSEAGNGFPNLLTSANVTFWRGHGAMLRRRPSHHEMIAETERPVSTVGFDQIWVVQLQQKLLDAFWCKSSNASGIFSCFGVSTC